MFDYSAKMAELKARGQRDRVDPSPEVLRAFERRFDLLLPSDYRAFVRDHAAKYVEACIEFQEPTPLGEGTLVDQFFGFVNDTNACDLAWATDCAEGKGLCVPIASSPSDDWFFLICSGRHQGQVFMRDHEQRHLWPDETFHARFERLSRSISRYLEARRSGELAPPLSGTPGWYTVGATFDDFLTRCHPRHF